MTKVDVLQPDERQKDFGTKGVVAVGRNTDDIGRSSFVFDIRYQKLFSSGHSKDVKLKIDPTVPAGVVELALILTN